MPSLPRLALAFLLPAALPGVARAETEWTRFLPDLAPALTACLEGEAASAAIAALPMNRGRAFVRLQRPDGERLDCIAELGPRGAAARRESREPAGASPPFPGEGESRFTRARPCAAAAAVPDGRGGTLGWLSPPDCR